MLAAVGDTVQDRGTWGCPSPICVTKHSGLAGDATGALEATGAAVEGREEIAEDAMASAVTMDPGAVTVGPGCPGAVEMTVLPGSCTV